MLQRGFFILEAVILLRAACGRSAAGRSGRRALRELPLGVPAGLRLLGSFAFRELALVVATGLGVGHLGTERQNGEGGNGEATERHGV